MSRNEIPRRLPPDQPAPPRPPGVLQLGPQPVPFARCGLQGALQLGQPAFLTRQRSAEWRAPESKAGSATYWEPTFKSPKTVCFWRALRTAPAQLANMLNGLANFLVGGTTLGWW